MTKAPSPPETRTASVCTKDSVSLSPSKQDRTSSKENHDSALLATLAARLGPLTTRVWAVCEKAKEDFFVIKEPNSLEKQSAAKYLRDSAENVLHHLADKDPDPRLINELQDILAVAKHTAMVLHGGKKRKFDHPESGYGNFPSHCGTAFRSESRGQRDEDHRAIRHVNRRYTDGPSDLSSHTYDRTIITGSHPTYRNSDRSQGQFFVPELHEKPAGRRRKSQKRGHSGIPYGYTRRVDSYQPDQ